jgi:hypothetical protein
VIALLAALILMCTPKLDSAGGGSSAAHSTSLGPHAPDPAATELADDDVGDDAVGIAGTAPSPHLPGAPLPSALSRAVAIGEDPPGVPPPKA